MNNKLLNNTLWLDLLNSDWLNFRDGGKHENDRIFREKNQEMMKMIQFGAKAKKEDL